MSAEENLGRRLYPMEGVEVWKNPKNKFFVFQLHFTANQTKRDPGYIENIKSAMPIRQFNQEYNLQWESYAGTPVYPDFSKAFHGSKETIDPQVGLPLIRGWDFGITPACVIAQYVGTQLRVLCEFTAINKGANQFIPEVIAECRLRFKYFSDYIDCIDPSGAFRKDTDMGTCAGIMAKHGLGPIPGPVAFEERKGSVEGFLVGNKKGEPNFLISLGDCPVLVRGFEGGYRYDEKAIDIEPQKVRPIKDEHSHPHDSLQYICSIVKKKAKVRLARVPSPQYFQSNQNSGTIHKEGGNG